MRPHIFERIPLGQQESPTRDSVPAKETETAEQRLRRKYNKKRKKCKDAERYASSLEMQVAMYARRNHQIEQEKDQLCRKLDNAQRALDAALRDEDGFIVLEEMRI